MTIKPGTRVLCRLFNTPEGKFYGETFTATVIEITEPDERGRAYLVKRENAPDIKLIRKEIKRII